MSALAGRPGVEEELEKLERGAALPVLPGLERRWLAPVRDDLQRVERLWSRQRARDEGALQAHARPLARREARLLSDLRGLCREVAVGTRVSEQLRMRILACAAGAGQLLDSLRLLEPAANG